MKRFGMVSRVVPGKLDVYRRLHAEVWPGVLETIRRSQIGNYSIYLAQLPDGDHYLFSTFEYSGKDFEADMKLIGEDSETIRWWKETDPCQIPFENRPEGQHWKPMEEVYHLD